jgi:hypothetical protein
MNQQNIDYLKNGLRSLGFGDKLNDSLEAGIRGQAPQFQLKLDGEFGQDKVQYTLDFKRSDQSERYFFNRYQATLKADNPADDKSQTFYVNKNAGITAKEAYNLLSGRAVNKDLVNKDGQSVNAWIQLELKEKDQHNNFKVKQFHGGYGYDLEKTVSKLPIRELTDPDQKEKLLKSLQKGNLAEVTFEKAGKTEKRFIEANPQYKAVTMYDADLKKIFQEPAKKESQTQQTNLAAEATDKKKAGKEKTQNPLADDAPTKKAGKKKGPSL